MISKAYECLTDENAKENCQKYGNPDGSNTFNVGIALPTFLIRKENQVKVMAVVFIILVIVIPLSLIYWNSNMNKYDEFGVLRASYSEVYKGLNEQLGINDVSRVVGMCS
jgi:translocation protein SEC63